MLEGGATGGSQILFLDLCSGLLVGPFLITNLKEPPIGFKNLSEVLP